MSFKKKLAVSAVVGGVALAAVPAFALENEFHGSIGVMYNNSNFNQVPNNADQPGNREFGYYNPKGLPKDMPTSNTIQQRTRILYNAKINNNVKVVTHFEIDYRFWGDTSYDTGRDRGAGLGADTVNLETKSAYMDITLPDTPLNFKIGVQPNDDVFKGIFTSADMAGALATATTGKFTTHVGFYRWNDDAFYNSQTIPGKSTRDFVMLDSSYAISDKAKVGGAYYFVKSNNANIGDINGDVRKEDVKVHLLGVNGEATFGQVAVDGFLVGQVGKDDIIKKNIRAFAGNVGAKMQVGKGTARAEFLYVSGDKDPAGGNSLTSFYTPEVFGLSESGYYNSEMVILGRDKYAWRADKSLVFSANNNNQGVIGGYIGYDMPFTSKLSGSANAGFVAVAQRDEDKASDVSGSKYLGTEINAETSYKVMENVTATFRGAYVFLGDYYKGVAEDGRNPENPYDLKFIVKVAF
jgi:hypothetical protein